jgi:hypothetical protein
MDFDMFRINPFLRGNNFTIQVILAEKARLVFLPAAFVQGTLLTVIISVDDSTAPQLLLDMEFYIQAILSILSILSPPLEERI